MGNKPSLFRHLWLRFWRQGPVENGYGVNSRCARQDRSNGTIWITFINKMAVTVSIPVMFSHAATGRVLTK